MTEVRVWLLIVYAIGFLGTLHGNHRAVWIIKCCGVGSVGAAMFVRILLWALAWPVFLISLVVQRLKLGGGK